MKIWELTEGVGRITKQNQTVDVGPNEITKQAKKFGNSVDKDGRPPTLSKKVKGSSTNVLFNLGLSEGIMLKFQRGNDFDTLHIKPKGKNRVELRGKPGYESGNYDAQDKLHQVLDNLGKAANFAELMNGETVTINPKHPDGDRAKKTAQDILSTERELTPGEEKEKERIVKGMKKAKGSFKDRYGKDAEAVMYATATKLAKESKYMENFADGKRKGKSRPGRVKRSGASCNGSVTSLRKKAKKYSGERGRMYHWCANMKSGRKKK
jgi:hypothetical protein